MTPTGQTLASQAPDETTAHVVVQALSKHFGGVQALVDVDVKIERGAIHGLVGENGAGKSTLGKIISGVIGYDEGQVVVDGRSVRYGSPRDALDDGADDHRAGAGAGSRNERSAATSSSAWSRGQPASSGGDDYVPASLI